MLTKFSDSKPIDIVREGWLSKKSRHVNRWRRRWIVLSTKYLYTYKSKESYGNATEIINLSDLISVKINNTESAFMLIDGNKNNNSYQFQSDDELNTKQWMNAIIGYINCIKIPINIDCQRNVDYCCNFKLTIPYHKTYEYSLNTMIKTTIKHIERRYNRDRLQFITKRIISDSFINKEIDYNNYDWKHGDINITDYDKYIVIQKGIHLLIDIAIYHHNPSSNYMLCPDINTKNNLCSIYTKMKYQNIFTENYLNHLYEYNHHKNEVFDKPQCQQSINCYSYKRLVEGGNDLKDRSHIKLYQHPARIKRIELSHDINSFCLNDEWAENKSLYKPTIEDMIKCIYNEQDGYLATFIQEVIRNGFKKYLYLNHEEDDNYTNYTIMKSVDDKLQCMRHKQMGSPLNRSEMLAIILYTGNTDCCYNLCNTQQNGDYQTWKWFDFCLYSAIQKLSKRENGKYNIYTGLNNVYLDCKFIDCGYFKTYISSSWIRDIALTFVQNKGILFQIDAEFRETAICCDVSWISSFGTNECEILIARSIDAIYNNFECRLIDENASIQTVLISPFGASDRDRIQCIDDVYSSNYPLMQSMDRECQCNMAELIEDEDIDIIDFIDGITEDIIFGYIRMLQQCIIPILIKKLIISYYLNINDETIYLYPKYIYSNNLKNILLFESKRITKYPNITYHAKTQQLAIGASLGNGHCMFLYDLNTNNNDRDIILTSSRGHTSRITAVQFSTNGTFLVSYSAKESCVKVWDIRYGEQKCIKTLKIQQLNKLYPLIDQLIYTKITWNDGVTLQRENKLIFYFDKLKAKKTYKTIIFIRDAHSLNNKFKNGGIKKKKFAKLAVGLMSNNNNNNNIMIDPPLSDIGIDEAFNLSRYINKHSSVLKKTQINDAENETFSKPIQDALYIISIGILDKNNRNLLTNISPNLLSKCEELHDILQDTNGKIQRFKYNSLNRLLTPSSIQLRSIQLMPSSIVSDCYDQTEDNTVDPIQTRLKTRWVLDKLIDSSSNNNSILISSNQRRAISTLMISLWDRFKHNNDEYIHLLPCLQELGENNSSKIIIPTLSNLEKTNKKFDIEKLTKFYSERLLIENQEKFENGNITKDKFELFCDWIFNKAINKKNGNHYDTLIICGHSNWFNMFLRRYLPETASFSKVKKIPNCSVVGFRMICHEIPDGSKTYQIVEKSITNCYRGFK